MLPKLNTILRENDTSVHFQSKMKLKALTTASSILALTCVVCIFPQNGDSKALVAKINKADHALDSSSKIANPAASLVLLMRMHDTNIDTTYKTSTCEDSEKFVVDGLEERTCDWLRTDVNRLIEFCEVVKVRLSCPKACGECCEDDPSFFMITSDGERSGCDWIAEQSKKRKPMLCDVVKRGVPVRDSCAKTCDACFATIPRDDIVTVIEMEGNSSEAESDETSQPTTSTIRVSVKNRILKEIKNFFARGFLNDVGETDESTSNIFFGSGKY